MFVKFCPKLHTATLLFARLATRYFHKLYWYLLEEGLGDLGRASNDELALGPLRQERVEQGAERVVPERHVDQDLQVRS